MGLAASAFACGARLSGTTTVPGCRMVRRLVIRANRQRDRIGLACPEPKRGAVAPIDEVFSQFANGAFGLDPDARGVIQGARDGRHRKTAESRNGLQGRAVAVFGK